MLDQLFDTFRKASESSLHMQQDMFKYWTQQWSGASSAAGNTGEWSKNYQKQVIDLLNKQREALDSAFKAGIQLIEQTFRASEAKSPESEIITIAVTKAPTVKVVYKQRGPDGLNEYTIELNPATLGTDLGPALKRARSAAPSARFVIKMDKGAEYGVIADMVAGLQQANATRFNVQTNLKEGAGMLAPATPH